MIQYNPYELDRHSIRLKEFDYSSEALFFVTVVEYETSIVWKNLQRRNDIE